MNLFVPRRDRTSKQNFIFDEFSHIQFFRHRQEIPGVVFQLVLRQFGTLRNNFQQVVDIEIERDGFEATLASQRDSAADLQLQHRLAPLSLETFKHKSDFAFAIGQEILQTFKTRYRQRSLENTAFSGKNESVLDPFQS